MIGVGQELGGYTILSRIGHGGLGDVYLAQHRRLPRRAAIKVLLAELSQKTAVLEQFFKEARNTSLIKHPGIVEILDCDLLDGQGFVIMEFLEGESLGGYLRRTGTLEQDLAFLFGVVAAAASAVEAAHVAGVIHRDLKPENVYLHLPAPMNPTVTVKILDFGIAKLSREDGGPSQTASGIWLGSPTYMSPEQCRGVGRPDARSDIYSLGCVFYEALCGQPPFAAQAVADLIAAHVTHPPRPPNRFVANLPGKVNSLVLRMLAKKPEERPQTMNQVIGTLRECARALGIDFDGSLLPLKPVERPVNMAGAPPVSPHQRLPAPAAVIQVPPRPIGPRPVSDSPVVPPSMRERVAMAAMPLPPVAPPVGAPKARGIPQVVSQPSQTPSGSEPVGSADPDREPSIRGFVGGTVMMGPPTNPADSGASRNAAHSPSIQGAAGGTVIMGWSEKASAKPRARPLDHPLDPSQGERNTKLPFWKVGYQRGALVLEEKGPLLVIVGGVVVLLATLTVVGLSRDTDPAMRTRERPARPAIRQRGQTRPAPVSLPTSTPVPAAPALSGASPAAGLATVRVDIEGLAPGSIVTVDDQIVKLPIRIRRGPEVHRITMRPPTGRERTFAIDGTRDRVIELMVARPTSPPSTRR
jgi:serine/threonine protein kinase